MKFVINLLIAVVIVGTIFFVYQKYNGDVGTIFIGEQTLYTIYVGKVALSVTVADDDQERKQGLSGVKSLGDLSGKLFIFDDAQRHGIWMKDMNLSIDILWFNNDLELVHIEKDITPDTFPKVSSPRSDARFVLEVNAKLVDSLQIKLGDRLLLPSSVLPQDIRDALQE